MKKADLIIIAVVLAVAGVLCFYLYYVNGDSGKYVEVENPYEKLTQQLKEYYHKSYYIKVNNKFLEIKIEKYNYDYDVVIKNENEKFKSIKDILNKYTLWEVKMTK